MKEEFIILGMYLRSHIYRVIPRDTTYDQFKEYLWRRGLWINVRFEEDICYYTLDPGQILVSKRPITYAEIKPKVIGTSYLTISREELDCIITYN